KAQVAQKILNSSTVQSFLKSIIFSDAKRPITKDILMRIDMQKVYNLLQGEEEEEEEAQKEWKDFKYVLEKENKTSNQMTIF
ncbi:MAG: hypothetical protein AAGG68_19855, partial [Bacteroidota bacterium]